MVSFKLITFILVLGLLWFGDDLFLPVLKVHPPGSAVLMTGASRGIGKAATLHLVGLGYYVYAGVRKEADRKALKEAAGVNAHLVEPLILDVAVAEHVDAALQHIQARNKEGAHPLFAVVNNAGVSGRAPFEVYDEKIWRQMIDINVVGATNVANKFMPMLRERQGRLVNIGSLAGEQGVPFSSVYSGTKHYLRAVSDAIRREVAPAGAHSSVVEPGYVFTDILASSLAKAAVAFDGLPPALRSLYAYLSPKSLALVEERDHSGGLTVAATNADIEHALLNPQPRARYLTANVRMRTLIKLAPCMPDWLADKFHQLRMARTTSKAEL